MGIASLKKIGCKGLLGQQVATDEAIWPLEFPKICLGTGRQPYSVITISKYLPAFDAFCVLTVFWLTRWQWCQMPIEVVGLWREGGDECVIILCKEWRRRYEEATLDLICGKTMMCRKKCNVVQFISVNRLTMYNLFQIHAFWRAWDSHHGMISKFWDIVVSPFVCKSVCVY